MVYVRRVLLIAFAVFSLLLLFLLALGAKEQNLASQSQVSEASLGAPVRLRIPAINVDASVQYVGVNLKGEMDAPSNTFEVGWFKIGSRPGERGSAVISGHFNGVNGKAGVFANLRKLKAGDKVYVEDDKGKSIAFTVRENSIYNPGYADPVFSRNDGEYLNLITCDGLWDEVKKSFSKRLVVFADIAR